MSRKEQAKEALPQKVRNESDNEIMKKVEAEIEKWRENGFVPDRINTRNLSIDIEDIDKAVQSIERTGIPAKNAFPRYLCDIAEHSICQPGLPLPQGLSQAIPPSVFFQSKKSS